MHYFSLSCYPIDFKPWHNDPHVLGSCAMTFLSHPSCYFGFIQDFLAVQRQKAVSAHIQISRYYPLALELYMLELYIVASVMYMPGDSPFIA